MNRKEIKEILNSYNIKSDVAYVCDDWIVTTDGDLVNIKWSYPIYSYDVNHDHWLAHLKEKKWFERSSFLNAFGKACEILNITVDLKDDKD